MSKTIPIEDAVKIALEQHQSGNYARAESLYVEILRQDPGNIDAMHLLGVLAHQGRKPDVAVDLISRAIARRGDVPIFHFNLAEAYVALDRSDEAIASYQRALELDPEHAASQANLASVLINMKQFVDGELASRRAFELTPDVPAVLNNLATAIRAQGRLAEAEPLYERAIAQQPDFVEAITNLAMCCCAMGKVDEGIARFQRAVQLRPAIADAHNNLGTALMHQGRVEEAIRSFATARELKPDHVEAINNLGSAMRTLGKSDQAISFFERAVEINPDFVEGHANLAAAYADLNRNQSALEELDRAIELRPSSSKVHFLRGIVLRNLYRNDEGVLSIRRALELDPNNRDAMTSLGYALLEQGELDAAAEMLTRGIAETPDAQSHSNVLMSLNYHPGYTPAALFAMHRRWSSLHEELHLAARTPHDNDKTPDRRLRVGYMSPDFRGHSVAYFLEPILRNHDRASFEVFGYAQVLNFDMSTYRLRTEVDHWRETSGKTHDEVATLIRKDRIDILIDLAGHTGGNLLPVFARKPAPVQVNMIGFPSTTGLSTIDYRITDTLCDPPGVSDAFNTETLVRMSKSFWVYQPPSTAGSIGNLPADDNGRVTFTSVNNFTKVTPQVQQMWARLLRELPTARLIIQTSAMNSEATQDLVRGRFAAEGVSSEQLEFRPWSNLNEYLSLLERSDITLDPFPFNGGTTTCHSLWMGAPVLTLAGDRHASRMGLSMMTTIGLPEFIAHTPEAYVAIGKRMANDLPYLREVRRTMRERLLASPLLDGPGYTRELEAAYRDVWAKWCATCA